MAPDSELLRQYAQDGSEAAFAELVRRYVDLVYSVALRQAHGDAAMAEDVTQVVFVDLARKARVLAGRETLAGWLHTSARFAASKAIRGEQRRRVREQEALIMNENTPAAIYWEQLRPLLDEGVGQLKEEDRDAIVLRFYQGKSHQEVGAILGLSENSANKRIERALEKLRTHFSRRGVTTTSAILGEVISASSVHAAPVGLAANVTQAALSSVAVGGAAGGALLTLLLMSTKTKTILGLIALLAVVTTVAIKLQSTTDSTSASTDRPTSASTQGATVPVRVEQPVVAAVGPAGQPRKTPTATAASVSSATPASAASDAAQPQPELKTAISNGLHFLEDEDLVGFFKTLMPPDALAKEGRGSSVEEFAQLAMSQPGMKQKIMQMKDVLNALQLVEPTLNDAGTRATYLFDPPVAGHKAVIFNKINGLWYLSGI